MAAAEAHARHCARMGADPDRAGRLWARGILLSIVAIFILGWLWPDPNGNAAGGPSMWLMIGVVVLGLPVLFVMMRFTPRKGGWPSSGLVGGPDGRGDHHPFAAGQRGGDWPVRGLHDPGRQRRRRHHPRRERGSLGRRRPHLVQRRGAARHLPRERFNRLGVVI